MDKIKKVPVLTGGSSGIGLATAQFFAARGWAVCELSRSGKGGEGIIHYGVDVTDEAALIGTFADIYAAFGRIDTVLCNAGFGISGAAECTAYAEAVKQFRVNYLGAVSTFRAAAPYLREQGYGNILFTGSVAGVLPIPFQAHYSAGKAAIAAFSRAAALEMQPFGVYLSAIQLGDVKTGFTAAREKSPAGADIYGERIALSVSKMEKDEQSGMPPSTIARAIYKIARKKKPAPLYTIGFAYKLIALLNRLLPTRLVAWILKLMYG